MDQTPMQLFVLLVTVVAGVVLLRLLFRRKAGGRLPPGPVGVPLLGRLPFLSGNLHRCFTDVCNAYGPISSFRLGTSLCVVVSSSSAAREVLKDRDAIFANHPLNAVANVMTKGGLDILFAPYGPHWRFGRRIAMRELLNSTVLNSFQSLRRSEVHRLIRQFHSRAGEVVNFRETVSSASLSIIFGMMWNDVMRDHAGNLGGLAREMKEVISGVVELSGVPNISDFIPALATLDLHGLQRRANGLLKRYDAVLDAIIDERLSKGGGKAVEKEKPKDFLQLLLDLVGRSDLDTELEMEHIKAIILDMITGAGDTTNGAVEWAMAMLVSHPEMMEKAQAELDAVVGRERVVEEEHLPLLRYLDAVVKETLRMFPPLPLLVPHQPSETTEIGGYTVPKGSSVFVNIWAIMRNPEVFERPEEFRPERFYEEEEEKRWEYHGKSFDFIPFGKGRRICPGLSMGERMVLYLLATLLHSLHWRLPEGQTTVDLEEKFIVVLRKKEPLRLVPSVRMEQYYSGGP